MNFSIARWSRDGKARNRTRCDAATRRVGLVHVDCDLYSSSATVLELLGEHLADDDAALVEHDSDEHGLALAVPERFGMPRAIGSLRQGHDSERP